MSASAGGGLIILPLLIGLAGAAIATAAVVFVTGAAVYAAARIAVAAARGINSMVRANHQRTTQASIDRTANRQLAQQRQQMLDLYARQSQDLERLSLEQDQQRTRLIEDAKKAKSGQQADIQKLLVRSRALSTETTKQLNQDLARLNTDTTAQLSALRSEISLQLSQRQSSINQRLSAISSQLERDKTALTLITPMMNETLALYNQLIGEPEAADLIAPQLAMLSNLQNSCRSLISQGQGQAALASVSAFTQHTMEAYHHLDMARHRRQLLREHLNLRAAALRAFVENGATLDCEGVKGLPSEANYWVSGALNPIMDRARQLLALSDQEKPLKIADYEKLLMDIDSCTQMMDSTLSQARQAYLCAFMRIQMLRKAQKGFAASGWKADRFGFVDGDFRKPAIMRFHNGAGLADLILTPVYDRQTGEYSVDVNIERHDAGVIDEGLRLAQNRQLSAMLQGEGLPITLTCDAHTAGRNADLDAKRFSNPGSSASN